MKEISSNFPYKQILVTGGAGFLGGVIVERLRHYRDVRVFVPRRADYDLVEVANIKRLLTETQPDLVIHLAAVVGGLGANQKNPGNFFENLMTAAQLIKHARLHEVKKFVALGRFALIPNSHRLPFAKTICGTAIPKRPTRLTD